MTLLFLSGKPERLQIEGSEEGAIEWVSMMVGGMEEQKKCVVQNASQDKQEQCHGYNVKQQKKPFKWYAGELDANEGYPVWIHQCGRIWGHHRSVYQRLKQITPIVLRFLNQLFSSCGPRTKRGPQRYMVRSIDCSSAPHMFSINRLQLGCIGFISCRGDSISSGYSFRDAFVFP